MTNSFGNRNFMQSMEDPKVHSRCLAFIPFKFREEGFFSFFFGSQCVPQHNITMCSFSLPPIKTPRTPPPSPPALHQKNKNHDQMFHKEWAVIEKIFQALPNFCPHRETDTSKNAHWIWKSHLVHTDSKYTVPDRLTDLLN
jgi:hypothetical protein